MLDSLKIKDKSKKTKKALRMVDRDCFPLLRRGRNDGINNSIAE